MQNKTGAVFFVLAGYTDADGKLSFARFFRRVILCSCNNSDFSARYETDGLGFLATRNEYRKGPNNITDVWTEFIEGRILLSSANTLWHTLTYENNPLGREEMADTDESLDVDDKGYPLLPDDVLGLRLRRKKAIMRQFMSAVRRTCC